METWQELLRKRSLTSLEQLAARFGPEHFPEIAKLQQAAENFEFRISPAMVDLIQAPDDPIWRQYVPTVQELEVRDGMVDSLAEDEHSPVPNITHRYPDRALFLVSPVCATYCRFCTRRREVGDPQKLLAARVRPYYIYMCDQVAGAEHFRTTVEKGLEIIKSLRGWTSGLAVPHFVIDAPGGGGKIPLLPEYVESINDDEVVLRNYAGQRFTYKQPRQAEVPVEFEPVLVG